MKTQRLRDLAVEMHELGPRGTAFRVTWEIALRLGLHRLRTHPAVPGDIDLDSSKIPFASPATMAKTVGPLLAPAALDELVTLASQAEQGQIRCFSAWIGDYGDPIDWHLDPTTGTIWDAKQHWWRVLATAPANHDVKYVWEIGRFPHAYHLARAAAFREEYRERFAAAFSSQVRSFLTATPYGRGPHWASGQEIAIRHLAWLFAAHALGLLESPAMRHLFAASLFRAAHHVEQNLAYARYAVHNNHVLSESLLLLIAGGLLRGAPDANRWLARGESVLGEETGRQFYADGGYIQLSHNYHRLAIQVVALGVLFRRALGLATDPQHLSALERSVAFLTAHQNPADGSLPNYGNNDGGLPALLTTCDYADFRPTLQCAALLTRGERLYAPGPWDEEAAWLLGPTALESFHQPRERRSVSFPQSGFHVLRDPNSSTFATFRCGTVRDRFTQIDMLHVDIYWRGRNVVVDPGSYCYNGPQQWHQHFQRTAAHNTATVDDLDQMLHHRRFKFLYPTQAVLLRHESAPGHHEVTGEHYGFCRKIPGCIHRRTVTTNGQDLWIVIDRFLGRGVHRARVHWLLAPGPWTHDGARLGLETPLGGFSVVAYDGAAEMLPSTVQAGRTSPPRGWVSRYYGYKEPAPSFAVIQEGVLPFTVVSVLGAGDPELHLDANHYVASGLTGDLHATPPGDS